MAGLLSLFIYSLPSVSSFLCLIAMFAFAPPNASAREDSARTVAAAATCDFFFHFLVAASVSSSAAVGIVLPLLLCLLGIIWSDLE